MGTSTAFDVLVALAREQGLIAARLGCDEDDSEMLWEIGRRLDSGWSPADTEYALRIIQQRQSTPY